MSEIEIVRKLLQTDDQFVISLGADLYVKMEANGYTVTQYDVGVPPAYEQQLSYSETFNTMDEAISKFISIRHSLKLGFDYDLIRMNEADNDC